MLYKTSWIPGTESLLRAERLLERAEMKENGEAKHRYVGC